MITNENGGRPVQGAPAVRQESQQQRTSSRRGRRGTSNRDARGNTRDRAARRAFLLATFGNGVTAPCYRCEITLDDATITVDRIVPGARGGRYVRGNIRPACGPCNAETGGAVRGT